MHNLPIGVRRDGSYYTRIEWCSHTENDPMFWVNNLILDDQERNGGTWAANTRGSANVVLSFFGEEQLISKIRIFRNVGATISILEELAKTINIYISESDEPRNLRTIEDDIDKCAWIFVKKIETEKAEGWMDVEFNEPLKAKFVRIELVENHGTPPDLDWTEINEIKIYG